MHYEKNMKFCRSVTLNVIILIPSCHFNNGYEYELKEKKEKKRFKFKPYKGRLGSSHVSRMSESLEETEMKMIASEIEASLEFKQMDKASGILNMPASCHSILKVR